MMRKMAVAILALLLFVPAGSVITPQEEMHEVTAGEAHTTADSFISWPSARWSEWRDYSQFGISIRTVYNGIEKQTPVLQALFNGVDVDNNPSTGVNGMDVKVSVIILPLLQSTDMGYVLSLSLALKVIRLGDEIKNGELEICLGGTVNFNGEQNFRIGFYSAEDEEIPREVREVLTVVPYLAYARDPEFYLNVEPVFDGENQDLSVLVEYGNDVFGEHHIMLDYFPAINTMIKVTPSLGLGKMNVSIERNADIEQTVRMRYEGTMQVNVTIEDVPRTMAFSLGFSDNYMEYKADDEFNASMMVELFGLEYLMRVEYLPRHFKAQFTQEGYIYLYTNQRKTTFIVANDVETPTSYFLITNLTGEAIIRWALGTQGFVTVDGFQGVHAETHAEVGNLYFHFYAEMQTEHFEITWNLAIPGSVFIDTNWEWVSFYSFNLSIDDLFGVLIEAHSLRANEWQVSWQTEVPFFSKEGTIDFGDLETFRIMLNGTWYPVF